MDAAADPRPVALTIAGSDSGGGAGIQMDLRVFVRCGAMGTTALAALTAQNLDGVTDVHGVPTEFVVAQVRAVLDGFVVRAAKTGMLWSEETVRAVAELWPRAVPLVVDPVMVATTGARLLSPGAERAYRDALAPVAAVLTPNLDEAAVLLETDDLAGEHSLADTARALADRVGCPVLLKGGHLAGDPIDILFDGRELHEWRRPRVAGVNSHGSGCMLSAAIAAGLAAGQPLVAATADGLEFVNRALVAAFSVEQSAARLTRLANVEAR